MTLVQAWIDSVQLLRPKNLKLFVLVTLNAILQAYKLLLKYWWWLLIFAIGCGIAVIWMGNSAGWGFRLSEQLLLFATCLATRPSVAKKDCAYFRSHMFAFLYIAVYLLVWPAHGWPTAFSVYDIFLILFFLDSAGGPKNFFLSLWYALKMIIFNFPLLVAIGILFYMPTYLFEKIYYDVVLKYFAYVDNLLVYKLMLEKIVATLVIPVGVCTYANIYIKKLHDQFDLYVKPVQIK